MEFIEKLYFLINKKGITKKKFLEDIGAAKNSFAYWKKNGTIPNGATLQKIADYFNVSVDYLFSGTVNVRETIHDNHGILGDTHAPVTINGASDQPLGDIERELLSICGKLDMKRKNALLTRAYELLEE